MGLETGNYIKDLDPDWPLGSDPKSQGDDHIRLTKKTTQQSFPNVDGPVLFTAAQLNALPTIAGFPLTGLQALYDGSLDNINKNSTYQLGTVTNFPSDYVEGDSGYIVTSMTAVDPDYSLQVIYGLFGANANKVWMRFESASAWSAWKLVVDGGAFPQRLAGYEDTGLHSRYQGDLNDIEINSSYIFSGTVNAPTDFNTDGWGLVVTEFYHSNNATAVQILYGMTVSNVYKIWMRPLTSTTWGAWILVVDGGAFPQRLAGYRDDGLLISYNGDANDIVVDSTYNCHASQVANLPSDYVGGGRGTLWTWARNSTESIQWLIGGVLNEYKQWQRYNVAGVWGAWKLVVDGSTMTRTGSVLTLTNVIVV